ncbi:MAG: hypothetical protein PUB69_01015 [Desulfovibrionaceae bacterium]|nr:hypothetical protein [Desulfovibrionaceae bacterium]
MAFDAAAMECSHSVWYEFLYCFALVAFHAVCIPADKRILARCEIFAIVYKTMAEGTVFYSLGQYGFMAVNAHSVGMLLFFFSIMTIPALHIVFLNMVIVSPYRWGYSFVVTPCAGRRILNICCMILFKFCSCSRTMACSALQNILPRRFGFMVAGFTGKIVFPDMFFMFKDDLASHIVQQNTNRHFFFLSRTHVAYCGCQKEKNRKNDDKKIAFWHGIQSSGKVIDELSIMKINNVFCIHRRLCYCQIFNEKQHKTRFPLMDFLGRIGKIDKDRA